MRFIFYDLDLHEQILRAALIPCLKTFKKDYVFYSVSDLSTQELEIIEGADYIIFYMISIPENYPAIRNFIKINKINAKTVALCKNNMEGISAVGNGSNYALRIPLEAEKIMHCYNYFN